ncbi:MAG: capsular biosynthesis protein [Lachnospiraceae bacterium]|nr:capsular biosynthesis protein [Lachnospiraceae bacterium]
MIDIHCHLLYGVDDGACTIEESEQMLRDAAKQGVTDVIVTPHYRQGMFPYHKDSIIANFHVLSKAASDIGVRLYPGCEYHADTDMVDYLRTGRCLTLAGSDYVLTEFSHDNTYTQIRNRLGELLSSGYSPVIAHAERYAVFAKDPKLLMQVKEMGALVQINANSILGYDGQYLKRICKKFLKYNLADIVASDCHNMTDRRSNMKDCMQYITKKYGEKQAFRLFEGNPKKILDEAANIIE